MSLTKREELIHLSVTFSNSFAVVTVSVLLHKQKKYDHGGQEGKPCLIWFWRPSQSSVQNTLTSGLPLSLQCQDGLPHGALSSQ